PEDDWSIAKPWGQSMAIFKCWLPHWPVLILTGPIILGAVIATTGLGEGIERTLQDVAWRIRQSSASGNLHIVEIDGRSISQIDRWPWPRRHHARVVDELRRAGAASIAFDIDFSSHSEPAEDSVLSLAMSRTGGDVILRTFRQRAGAGPDEWI